ncbi:MAG: GDSL-type esterase/lipase family protein, partial [Aeoliella sp.]
FAHLLAPDYEVRSFANSSLCLLRRADQPYVKTPEFQAALDWAPDVVTIMLGTNDTIDDARPNWRHHADLEADTLHLIHSLRESNPDVTVHLLGPPPIFPDQSEKPARAAQLKDRVPRAQTISETYRLVAQKESRVFYYDLMRAFNTTSDGVHPDTFGHEALAREIYQRLAISYDESFNIESKLRSAGIEFEQNRWHGYLQYTFAQADATCHVVAPHQAAENHPWIWRARFFGHEPELDLSLLDRGFHLAYCDVANLYGSREALARWDLFHSRATHELSLSPQPILEGMSRGGLPIFFWASRNPDKVAAIYGDNPVCNSLSWPGGKNGKRSDADWQRLLAEYKTTDENSNALPQPRHPDILKPIAEKKIPVALVVGLADDVVPPTENALPLVSEYESLGGSVKVWRKPGKGHHPHGLHPPAPLRRFLLRARGYTFNPAANAVPSVEYRSGAGWGADWNTAFAHLKKTVAENSGSQLVFLGDSITQGLTGHQDRVARPNGQRAIDRHFGDRKALSLGLSGDRTEHVLWRLQNGQLDGLSPAHIVLMIGVNNINSGGHTGDETAEGTAAIVRWLRKNKPDAKVILLGCFPAGQQPTDSHRAEIEILHQEIAPLADGKKIVYVDLRPHFLTDDGTLNQNMSGDAIHISRSGQEVWMKALVGVVE